MPPARAPNQAAQATRTRWNRRSIVAALDDWVERYGEVPDRVDWDRHMCRRRGHHAKLARLDAHPQPLPSPAPVLRSFGTWQAALAAAGYQARYLPRRLREDEREVNVALYQSGLSTGQIAERLGV